MKFQPLAALEMVIVTTSGAACDENWQQNDNIPVYMTAFEILGKVIETVSKIVDLFGAQYHQFILKNEVFCRRLFSKPFDLSGNFSRGSYF